MNVLKTETQRLLDLLGHTEDPIGVYYTNAKPEYGYGPKEGERFSRDREAAGEIDWQKVGDTFSCIIGNVWLARKKRSVAWISADHAGCIGGGFYSGMYAPFMEFIPHYVSTGIPGFAPRGERYMPSPDSMRLFLEAAAPRPAPATYCVLKPLFLFEDGECPEVVTFFVRGEVLAGLAQLAFFATGDIDAVAFPFGAGCTSSITWPLTYLAQGKERAVVGGSDPSCRKFVKTDEMIFSLPISLYRKILAAMNASFLTGHTWEGVRKKVLRSRATWGEEAPEASVAT